MFEVAKPLISCYVKLEVVHFLFVRRDGLAAGGDAPRAALGGVVATALTLHRVYPLSDCSGLGHQPPIRLLWIHLHRRLDRRLHDGHHTRSPPQAGHPIHQVVAASAGGTMLRLVNNNLSAVSTVSQLINNQFKPPSPFTDRSISKTTKTQLVLCLGELGPDGTVSEYSIFISPTMSFVEVKKQSRYNR